MEHPMEQLQCVSVIETHRSALSGPLGCRSSVRILRQDIGGGYVTGRCLTFGMVRLSNFSMCVIYWCSVSDATFYQKLSLFRQNYRCLWVYIDEQVGG